MAEYIDQVTAIAKLTALEVTEPNATITDAKRVLADMQTADVAPVVRCKDCKYLVNATVNSNGFLICHVNDMEIAPEDFCSYGERKNGGDNDGESVD
nr:MAG TPA: hypothetical protein [Caudoviricetes sp.]